MKNKIKSARSKGVIGKNAIIPRILPKLLENLTNPVETHILDFGCGPDMIHVLNLQKQGFNVSGYDITLPKTKNFLKRIGSYGWDIIYLSNVINVQSSKKELDEMFDTIWSILHPYGFVIVNYPNKPRYIGWSVKEMEDYLKTRFLSVLRVEKELAGRNVVWVLK